MRQGRRRGRLVLAVVVLSTLLLSACGGSHPLDTLNPKGTSAREIDNLLYGVLVIAAVVFVFVFGGVLYMVARFRVKEYTEDDWPEQVHGNNKVEIAWTIAPAILLAIVAVFTLNTLFKLNKFDDKNDMTVVVVGQQWWWEYRYYLTSPFDPNKDTIEKPADIVTATQLVIPAGKEVKLYITSRDVIHSFWIPNLNGKKDAVPGRVHPWKIQADDPGLFWGQCTEFCGLSHSRMRMQAVALSEGDWNTWTKAMETPYKPASLQAQTWLSQQKQLAADATAGKTPSIPTAQQLSAPTDTAESRGMAVFRTTCTGCHLISGVNDDIFKGADQISGAAPDLTHFASRTTYAGGIFELYNADGSLNRNQLEAWLRNPPAEKDAYAVGKRGMPNLGLSEDAIDDLVAFLMSTAPKPDTYSTDVNLYAASAVG